MARKSTKQRSTKRRPTSKQRLQSRPVPVTVADSFTEMILALRALEHMAIDCFITHRSKRTEIKKSIIDGTRLIQTQLPGFVTGHCHPPVCDAGDGTCEPCGFDQLRGELAEPVSDPVEVEA